MLSENIKKYRKAKGLTQKELGQLLGKTESAIQKYEAKENKNSKPPLPVTPPYDVIKELAEIFEIDVSELLGVEDQDVKKDYNFDSQLIRDLIYDIYEEIFNHSLLRDKVNMSSGEFIKKDKYFINDLLFMFIDNTLRSINTLILRIKNNDNAEVESKLALGFTIEDDNGAEIERVIDITKKLNDKDYVLHKIKYYKKLLRNIEQNVDNYKVIESGLAKAKADYFKEDKDVEVEPRKATQKDFDRF